MKKRIIDLRTQRPIPDIANYSRPGPGVVFTEDKLVYIASTVCRVPEGMVKVSGGGRTLQLGAHSAASGEKTIVKSKPMMVASCATRDSRRIRYWIGMLISMQFVVTRIELSHSVASCRN
jgi:hypothetical protein